MANRAKPDSDNNASDEAAQNCEYEYWVEIDLNTPIQLPSRTENSSKETDSNHLKLKELKSHGPTFQTGSSGTSSGSATSSGAAKTLDRRLLLWGTDTLHDVPRPAAPPARSSSAGLMEPQCQLVEGKFSRHAESSISKYIITEKKPKKPFSPQKCKICSKVFYLRAHVKRHAEMHSRMPFSCDQCDKCFKVKEKLEKHKLVHKNCDFKCDVCERDFCNAGSLKSHKLIHSNERPHECDICHKTFRQTSALANHYRSIHTDRKPYQCDRCEKRFALKGNLRAHQQNSVYCIP